MVLRFDESGLDCVGISVGRSIFVGRFKVQWHTLSRRLANVEIKVRLFVAFGVLLPPQYKQKRRRAIATTTPASTNGSRGVVWSTKAVAIGFTKTLTNQTHESIGQRQLSDKESGLSLLQTHLRFDFK